MFSNDRVSLDFSEAVGNSKNSNAERSERLSDNIIQTYSSTTDSLSSSYPYDYGDSEAIFYSPQMLSRSSDETSNLYSNMKSNFFKNTPELSTFNSKLDADYYLNSQGCDVRKQLNFSKQNMLSNLGQSFVSTKSGDDKSSNISASDRFIPNRKTSQINIALSKAHETSSDHGFKSHLNSSSNGVQTVDPNIPDENSHRHDMHNITVANLYKFHVLGSVPGVVGGQKEVCTRDLLDCYKNNNIFRFQQDQKLSSPLVPKNLFDFDDRVNQYFFRNTRQISKVPFQVLDAPALQDDFYLNLIDWSSQNILAVGLSSCVYLWSAHSSKVTKLCDLGISDAVTSVHWALRGPFISIGTNTGDVQIWDSVQLQKLRVLSGHAARVGCLAWNSNVLTSGSRDKSILYRDIRVSQNFVSQLHGHKQEVCGLKWSFDEQQLASGGNDNQLFVWNSHSNHPIIRFNNHTAAVKALAWSPHQHGLLVSGGGTADRTIRFWNTLNSTQISSLDTGSQVCNLTFAKNVNELVSTHGYSLNQIIIWSYPQMQKLATLTGHTYRVLYLAISPDGQTIVTGAGDQTLRFWNVFPNSSDENEKGSRSLLLPSNNSIR